MDGMNRIDSIRKKRIGKAGSKRKLSYASFMNHPVDLVHPVYLLRIMFAGAIVAGQ